MALKTLKKKYDELLKVFEEVGVTLSESQKETLDTFMLDFQAKLDETRDSAIKATKRIVEERLEKEFKEVFESITAHQKELFEKASKIDVIKTQKLMTEAVDQYLTSYVKEILPKKSIVDYGRMQKLEQIHESLRGMLLVNDDAVEKKVDEVKGELEAKMANESQELKAKLEEYKNIIEESKKQKGELEKKYAFLEKKDLISEKTKNLPIVESKRVKEKLSKMTVEDIKKNFKTVLESVQNEIQDERDKAQEEKNLEEAITDIVEGSGNSEKNGDGGDKGTESDTPPQNDNVEEPEQSSMEDDEEAPVTESLARAYMRQWIDTLEHISPKR